MAQQVVSSETRKNNFDSDFCGSIPLNFINLIQRHGVLLVLEKKNFQVVQISDNCKEILDVDTDQILNKNIAAILSPNQIQELRIRLEEVTSFYSIPLNLEINFGDKTNLFTLTIHNKESYALIEIEREKPIEGNKTFTHLHQQIMFVMVKLKEAKTIEELSMIAAREIKALSLFDRVMIYKFDEEWNGMAIGEAREEDMEPYLYVRFPASDIPKQARNLYLKNSYRLIPDRQAKPARLIPVMNPIVQGFTDLSDCNLRSVPAVHLEYLKNMNVVASMSTPIIKEGKLWGLISCHHKSSKFPSYELLSGFELLSGIISSQIVARENEETLKRKNELIKINGKILERIYKEKLLSKSLFEGEANVLELLQLDGAVLISSEGVITKGKVPGEDDIKNLVDWIDRRNTSNVFFTDCLGKIYVEAKEMKKIASGFIAIQIDFNKRYYLFGFRPEVLYTVNWGGNPNEAIQMEGDGKTYHPRNSFSIWKEIVKDKSVSWNKEEIEASGVLRANILEKTVLDNGKEL